MNINNSAFHKSLRTGLVCVVLTTSLTLTGTIAAQAETVGPPNVVDLSVDGIRVALSDGVTTSVNLTQQYLERIAAYDSAFAGQPGIEAVITVNPEALQTAADLDAERAAGTVRGPLHGVPILIKDNYDTGDLPTSGGSLPLASFQPIDDATQVERLREAGAIVIAKVNMDEFAYGRTGTSSLGGQTRNPYNQAWGPGGSSAGVGAGVAADFGAAGMGTDTCGSIRVPAASNNLVGLRPTEGLASRDGIMPMAATQDTGGPIAQSVTDVALLLDATVGYDPKDPLTEASAGMIPDSYVDSLDPGALDGSRIGLIVSSDYLGTSGGQLPTTTVIQQAASEFSALGATVEQVSLPNELSAAVSGAGLLGGYELRDDLNEYFAASGAVLPAEVASLTQPADALTLSDLLATGDIVPGVAAPLTVEQNAPVPNPAYEQHLASRAAAQEMLADYLMTNGFDALAYPTARTAAPDLPSFPSDVNCGLSAQTGFPAITVPAGFTSDGRPVGIELLGQKFSESTLLGLAYSFEQGTDHRIAPTTVPALAVPALAPASPNPSPSASAPVPSNSEAPTSAEERALAATGSGGPTIGAAAIAAALALVAGLVLSVRRCRSRAQG